MRSYRWQDWTTIRGGVTTVTQGETEWLDLEACEDVFFWVQVSNVDGNPTLTYQTSPTLDDSLFTSMLTTPITLVGNGSVVVTPVLMLTSAVPLARFVRWQLSGTPTWDVTFRVMVAGSTPGSAPDPAEKPCKGCG